MTTAPYSLITRQEAATILRISLGALDRRIANGDLPAPQRIGTGRRLYWRAEDFYLAVGNYVKASPAVSLTRESSSNEARPRPRSTVGSTRGHITGSATER
jgi:predicted DNA-binding transcriptional regulator AlpA